MHQGHTGSSAGQMPHPTLKSHLCARRGLTRGRPKAMFLMAPALCHHPKGLSHSGLWSRHLETPFFPLPSFFPSPHQQTLPGRAQTEIQPTLGKTLHFRGKGSCYGAIGAWVWVRAHALQECCPALMGKLPRAVGLPSLSTSVLCLSGFRLCSLRSSPLASPSSFALPPHPLPA